MKSHLAIVIVNWNGKELLGHSLPALQTQTVPADKVIVVDNGSTDGSLELMRAQFPFVQVMPLDHNTGFAYPNNVGMNEAFKDPEIQYVIALNNDTEVAPNYIEEMIACAQRHPDAGAIQPKVVNFYDTSRIDCVGMLVYPDMSAMNRGQGQQDTGQFNTEEEVFGAGASAALYTRAALEKVMLPDQQVFDNDYFAYYEDVDLAWRLRLAGFTTWYTPKAVLRHIHSATGKSHSPFKAYHIHRNHYYNMIKNFPLPFLIAALLFMPIRYGLLLSSMLRKKGPSAELAKKSESKYNMVTLVLRSWREIVQKLPSLLRKRKLILANKQVTNRQIRQWLRSYRADLSFIIYGGE